MKRFLILIVLMLAGCGESTYTAKVEQQADSAKVIQHSETEDVFAQLSKAFIISEQEGKLLNNLKLITDQQAEIIVGIYETNFVTGPALDPIGLPLNGLSSITNHQAETLGKVRYHPPKAMYYCTLYLNGLTSINEEQAKGLSKAESLELNGLTSITDKQAKSLGRVEDLYLNGLTSISDQQAESLSNRSFLELNGLASISNQQAENLSKIGSLVLNGLTSITDQQAESLGKAGSLELKGLTSITDTQAKSLRKIPLGLVISDACYDVVSRYMKVGLTKASERKY